MRYNVNMVLVLWIYEFLFNSGGRISKEKKLWKVWELKIKYDIYFQRIHCFLVNTPLFVCIEQKSKTEVRKQPFKCVL